MTDTERYVLEEWAEEYQQGRLGRREMLRRIAMMAGGAALAIPVLQSLGLAASPAEVAEAASSTAPVIAQVSGVTVPPNDPALQASMMSFSTERGQGIGYLAQPRSGGPAPGILVIHENRGLSEHFKDVARRYAKVGYAALAVDLASHEGGTEKYADLAQVSTILAQTPPDQHVATMNAAVRHLQGLSGVRRDRIGATGFCFGGGMTWRLATANAELRTAVPYYGSNPPIADVPKIKAAVLAIYGALDTRLNQGIPAIREALQAARVTHEVVIFQNADHAFFNDTGQRHNATASREAWSRTVAWFDRYLKG